MELVAVDLETTGFDPAADRIIEIGAVRFTLGGDGVALLGERFSTFVDPGRPLGAAIVRLTGIRDEDLRAAAQPDAAAARLRAFAGDAWLVGHNVAFDLAFLERVGWPVGSRSLDTADLASVLFPDAPSYALQSLAAEAAIDPGAAHRALDDALTSARVLGVLAHRARELDPALLAECAEVARILGEPAAVFFREASSAALRGTWDPTAVPGRGEALPGGVGSRGETRGPATERADGAADLLGPRGPLARSVEGFEDRAEQRELARAIERTMETGGVLVAEAGTGVGKSLAYLIPAFARASRGERVLVSTHALPLQDQLVRKDIPALQAALGDGAPVAVLKGRSNYLCPRRWQVFRGVVETVDEARLLLKTLVWRTFTVAGDRAELNLFGGESEFWSRISADDESCTAARCAAMRGACHLERARFAASQAGVVVVNHALLLHDARAGNAILPEADHVIVDEAHRLEDVAADTFGFRLEDWRLRRDLERIAHAPLVAASLRSGDPLRSAPAQALRDEVARAHDLGGELFAALHAFLGDENRARITAGVRLDEARWLGVEIAAERLADALGGVRGTGDRLAALATGDAEDEALELQSALKELIGTQGAIAHGIHDARAGEVSWVERSERSISLRVAPAHVGNALRRMLVDRVRSVVFTSATLAVDGSLAFAVERLGVADIADTLVVGSPFDYPSQAVLLVPSDGPLPHEEGYAAECALSITEIGRELGGRTLALFTSHAAMREVSERLDGLESSSIAVLTQGIDGSRRAILERFARGGAVLLGTQSFWEGVDLPGDLLQCVVIARLPFDVPDDPLVQGRSERYDDPFAGYQLPQAALRLRQGAGRLIRTRTDRGAIVVLDRRIITRDYGPTLLGSLPPARLRRVPADALAATVSAWCAQARIG